MEDIERIVRIIGEGEGIVRIIRQGIGAYAQDNRNQVISLQSC